MPNACQIRRLRINPPRALGLASSLNSKLTAPFLSVVLSVSFGFSVICIRYTVMARHRWTSGALILLLHWRSTCRIELLSRILASEYDRLVQSPPYSQQYLYAHSGQRRIALGEEVGVTTLASSNEGNNKKASGNLVVVSSCHIFSLVRPIAEPFVIPTILPKLKFTLVLICLGARCSFAAAAC